jgi:hypothetical protein
LVVWRYAEIWNFVFWRNVVGTSDELVFWIWVDEGCVEWRLGAYQVCQVQTDDGDGIESDDGSEDVELEYPQVDEGDWRWVERLEVVDEKMVEGG